MKQESLFPEALLREVLKAYVQQLKPEEERVRAVLESIEKMGRPP